MRDACTILGCLLVCLQVGCKPVVAPLPEQEPQPVLEDAPLVSSPPEAPIPERGVEFIAEQEVGDRAYYNKFLVHPTWPGASSGVTVAIGYDCGMTAKPLILSDWQRLREDWRYDLADTSGITGAKAKPVAQELAYIAIEWGLATEVFNQVTIPRFWLLTQKAFPGVEDLCPNARIALTSLVFNRGPSMVGPTRVEMKAIRELVPKKDYRGIANQIRASKWIWEGKGLNGLLKRRDAEADLVLSCEQH